MKWPFCMWSRFCYNMSIALLIFFVEFMDCSFGQSIQLALYVLQMVKYTTLS